MTIVSDDEDDRKHTDRDRDSDNDDDELLSLRESSRKEDVKSKGFMLEAESTGKFELNESL
jgi:hypothetical protein